MIAVCPPSTNQLPMLIYLDAVFLEEPEREKISSFLRKPFIATSCALVAERLPHLAPAYIALAATMPAWRGGHIRSQITQADQVFQQVAELGSTALPLVQELILARQVELLEELVRDHADYARKGAEPGAEWPQLDDESSRAAIRAFSFHEAVFLTLMGILEVRAERRLITFSFTAHGSDILYNRTLTTTMDAQSQLSLTLVLRDAIARLRAGDRSGTASIVSLVQPDLLDTLETVFLDSFFSIGEYMAHDPDCAKLTCGARALCRWFALLELVRVARESTFFPSDALCEGLRLDRGLLDKVVENRSCAVASDRGIHVGADGSIGLGMTSLAHAIHCCKPVGMSGQQANKIGDKFEEEIEHFVQKRVPADDYVVRPGFQRSANGEGEMYDCDRIIYEVARRQIFFVQAKWKRDSRTADLGDELHDWRADNWPMKKGVAQLSALRRRLAEKDVLKKVRDALGDIALSDEHILANSHYVVVHTLPFFSAYEKDGVAIYEWNLFRKLLQRGAIERTMSVGGPAALAIALPGHRHDTVLRLEDPRQVLDYFYAATGGDLALLPRERKDREQARYGFDLALPPTSRWQRLIGSTKVRVVRPYT